MNNETFEVGELAIIAAGWILDGMDVTVVSELRESLCVSTGVWDWVYDITGPGLPPGQWCAPPRQLRKKRPPQDWAKLCKLDSVKAGEPAEVV